MIYAYQVYETLLDLARKDLRGRSLTVEEFNSVSVLVNQNVFSKYYSEFESNPENTETMAGFKVLNEAIPIVAGVGTLPANYYATVGMPWYTDTGGTRRYLDLVSSMEHAKREQDFLTKGTLTYPTFMLGLANAAASKAIHVTPSTGINPIYLNYIRTADVPFLDYYVNDTTLVYTWMASGGGVVAVPAGSTARDGTVGAANVASLTVEWEWEPEDMPLIINLFLKYLGIQLPDPILFEGGTNLEAKEDEQ